MARAVLKPATDHFISSLKAKYTGDTIKQEELLAKEILELLNNPELWQDDHVEAEKFEDLI